MVNITKDFLLILLEQGLISYTEYINDVEPHDIPPEYATYALFMKNKGKASKRIRKEMEWRTEARRQNLID